MIKKSQLEVLFNVVKATNDYHLAYTKAGISKTTFYEKKENDPKFSDELEQAEAAWELSHVIGIREAGKKQWQARAWLLERAKPEKYSLVKRHELSGPGGRPVPVAVAAVDLTKVMTLDQLEKLAVVLDSMKETTDGTGETPPGV